MSTCSVYDLFIVYLLINFWTIHTYFCIHLQALIQQQSMYISTLINTCRHPRNLFNMYVYKQLLFGSEEILLTIYRIE